MKRDDRGFTSGTKEANTGARFGRMLRTSARSQRNGRVRIKQGNCVWPEKSSLGMITSGGADSMSGHSRAEVQE